MCKLSEKITQIKITDEKHTQKYKVFIFKFCSDDSTLVKLWQQEKYISIEHY